MAVGVGDVDLKGPVGADAARDVFLFDTSEILLPLVEVVGPEGEMVAAGLGINGVFATTNQVQFLKVA